MLAQELYRSVRDSVRDLLPIVIVIGVFQGLILRQPIPNLEQIALGGLMVVLGLTLFIRGLEMALFPIGETLAHGLARKGSVPWLIGFSFALGFGTTVAEPALIAIADQAAQIAAGGHEEKGARLSFQAATGPVALFLPAPPFVAGHAGGFRAAVRRDARCGR